MVLSGRWCCLRVSKPRKKRGRVIKRVTEINFRVVNSGKECKTCPRYTSCPFECYVDCLESRVNYWFTPSLFNFDREQGRVID